MTPQPVLPEFVRYLVVTDASLDSMYPLIFEFNGNLLFRPRPGGVLLLDIASIQIGRSRNARNTFIIDDPAISRVHCRFSFDRNRWWIEDLQSRNGIQRNGIGLIPNQPISFEVGDMISLPGFSFWVQSEPINPFWLNSNVIELCQSISHYGLRDRLPILSDALRDVGCFEDIIHDACLNPPQRFQRHWVVEWILDQYHQLQASLRAITIADRKVQ